MGSKDGRDTGRGRNLIERHRWFSKPCPVAVLPGDVECLPILFKPEGSPPLPGNSAKTARSIDLTDALDRRKLKAGLSRIGKELERPGADYGVIGNLPRRAKVSFQTGILHELDIAKAGEALATSRVCRRINPGLDAIDTRQIANRIAVFTTRQPAHRYTSRITVMPARIIGQRPAYPVDGGGTLGITRLWHPDRWHRLLLEHQRHALPLREVLTSRGRCRQLVKIETGFRGGHPVAGETVRLEYRPCLPHPDQTGICVSGAIRRTIKKRWPHYRSAEQQ